MIIIKSRQPLSTEEYLSRKQTNKIQLLVETPCKCPECDTTNVKKLLNIYSSEVLRIPAWQQSTGYTWQLAKPPIDRMEYVEHECEDCGFIWVEKEIKNTEKCYDILGVRNWKM